VTLLRTVSPAKQILLVLLLLPVSSCGGGGQGDVPPGDDDELIAYGSETALRLHLNEPWTGDFDGMVERTFIRVLVPFSKTYFFISGGSQRGITYEALKLFEEAINKELTSTGKKINVVAIPTARSELVSGLVEGRGDIAAGGLTITPERLASVDFSAPLAKGVREIVLTGPSSPPMSSIEDLSGREIYVRRASSYYDSLRRLNETLVAAGKAPITLTDAEVYLEDEDLMEMLDSGLLQLIVVDEHKAKLWAGVFTEMALHPEIAVRSGAELGWAFRKGSPQLAEVVNRFVDANKQGTLTGNVLINRYFKNRSWVHNSLAPDEMRRFGDTVGIFAKYAPQYDFDHLMIVAQGYQESRLDQSARSSAGAVGIMQLLPSTAADKNVGIPDISTAENNVHAGVKYMRFILDTYFPDDSIDDLNKTLFAFASYNAGPNRIRRLRAEAADRGLDPNIWFRNVELIVYEKVGREPVDYVRNIYKYYAVYRLAVEQGELRRRARAARGGG
jgi:membrane-bound lytic murein transglycosylase MltF